MENRGGQSAAHGQTPVQHVLKGLVIQPELSDVSLPMCQLFSHGERVKVNLLTHSILHILLTRF